MGEGEWTVLVLDPDVDLRSALRDQAAQREGLAVDTAPEPPDTTTLSSFDGLISEYCLGDTDGLDVIERARDAGGGLPAVLLTDVDPARFAERAFAVGVDDFVPKDRSAPIETALDRIECRLEEPRSDPELARRYERLLDQNVIGVYVIEAGVLEYCNERTADIWGYDDPSAMTGRPVVEFIHSEYRDSVRENVDRVLDGAVIQRRLTGLDAEEEPVEIEVHSWRIDRAGTPAVMGVCQDVTERVERRRRLETQNDRLETMASVISHDLRNPLNVATGYVDLLADDVDDDRLETVADALDRIDAITSDLLTMTQQNRQSIDPESLSLRRAAREAWRTVETAEAELSVVDDRSIEADPQRLAQCFENLFANAVEHGGAGVTVTVEPLEDGFAVEDTGQGIDPDAREQIFERGYTSDHHSTGLGLAIVASVADAHGWDVSVGESDASGARFEFHDVTGPTNDPQ